MFCNIYMSTEYGVWNPPKRNILFEGFRVHERSGHTSRGR